jgi:DNA mismatch repair ATPase MutS
LAGLPKEILDRAKEILVHLEKANGTGNVSAKTKKRAPKTLPTAQKPQLDLL